ncbi:hypothetical protein M3194_27595 [Paenibacillus glycanilyticus]|uniref:hypothetical protein n=1 Tax=Paenibacillus glycanilyticus TaxID=126569 RepID=UPI00203DB99F|nr:hypothetical protein [Paenibacillus glycanilyticus]MCM3631082.1 hypothetical protein [Paenibacillus glycanilyticus]
MKIKSMLGLIILIYITVLVGCTNDDKGAKEKEYSYQDVIDVFESQNLKLAPYGMTGNIQTLNDVVPEMNSIESEATIYDSSLEYVYFYIFQTETAREAGVKEFNEKMKYAKFTTNPFLYEKGNVLTIYWASSKEKPLFNELIKSAIENL